MQAMWWHLAVTVLGGVSGIVVYLQSRRALNVRRLLATGLSGGLLSLATVAAWYGDDVVDNPWPAIAVAILIGLGQPRGQEVLLNTLKRTGANEP